MNRSVWYEINDTLRLIVCDCVKEYVLHERIIYVCIYIYISNILLTR